MKISRRDVSLLIGFLGILVAFLAYWFGYRNILESADKLEEENSRMRSEIAELEALEQKREFFVSSTEEMQEDINSWMSKFATNVLPEDNMKFAYQQDKTVGDTALFINSISFGEPALLYTTNQNSQTTENTTDGTATTSAVVTDGSMIANGGTLYPTYYLYQSQTTYGLECSYNGLKSMVDSIYQAADRKSVDSVSVAFDDTTGQLNGSIVMNSYYVLGMDKPYAQPSLVPVRQGTDNIFGTIDAIPEAETEN